MKQFVEISRDIAFFVFVSVHMLLQEEEKESVILNFLFTEKILKTVFIIFTESTETALEQFLRMNCNKRFPMEHGLLSIQRQFVL